MTAKVGPVTIFGKTREKHRVICDGCDRSLFAVWDVKAFGVSFALCQRCVNTAARMFALIKTGGEWHH